MSGGQGGRAEDERNCAPVLSDSTQTAFIHFYHLFLAICRFQDPRLACPISWVLAPFSGPSPSLITVCFQNRYDGVEERTVA